MYIRQPNSWSCLPAAFANLTGIDIDDIIVKIGHDGSEIIYPNQIDPYGRKGFHDFEVIQAMTKFNHYFCPFLPIYETAKGIQNPDDTIEIDNTEFVREVMREFDGVLCGNIGINYGHAVSWIDDKIVDPKGSEYPLGDNLNKVDVFWAWINVPRIRF